MQWPVGHNQRAIAPGCSTSLSIGVGVDKTEHVQSTCTCHPHASVFLRRITYNNQLKVAAYVQSCEAQYSRVAIIRCIQNAHTSTHMSQLISTVAHDLHFSETVRTQNGELHHLFKTVGVSFATW